MLMISVLILLFVLFIVSVLVKKIVIKDHFYGKYQTAKKLNKTLLKITKQLYEFNIKKWFIGYGTLLGIIRNNSCIEGDDDIDIIIDRSEVSKLNKLVKYYKYKYQHKSYNFTRIFSNYNYSQIDFYMAKKSNNDYIETVENLKWVNVYPIKKKEWNGVYLNLPNNYMSKLKILYINVYKKLKRNEYKTVHERKINIIE